MFGRQLAIRLSPKLTIVFFSLALIGAGSMLSYYAALFVPRVRAVRTAGNLAGGYAFGNDFYPIWLTSRKCLQNRCDLYDEQMTVAIQTGLFGRRLDSHIPTDPLPDYRTFAYPAFTDLLFWPAAEFPFTIVRVVLMVLLAGLTAASVLLWMRALNYSVSWNWLAIILLVTLGSYPVFEGLYAGQLGLLVGFFLAASLFALHRGRLFFAGCLLALTGIKPQMSLLAGSYLLFWSVYDWRARGRLAIGFSSTTLVLVGASLLVWPHWIPSWIHVLLGYHRYAEPTLVAEVLGSPFGPAAGAAGIFLTVALLLAAAILGWRNRDAAPDSFNFWHTLSLLLAITVVTIVPGQAVHDHVILLPGILLLAANWQNLGSGWKSKILQLAAIAVLLWPWPASLCVIALRPLLNDQHFYSKAVLGLPFRTAGMFPFIVLGLLALLRRASARSSVGEMVTS